MRHCTRIYTAIQVEVSDLTGTEFTRLAEIIPRGVTAARRHEAELASLSVSPEAFAAYRAEVLAVERHSRQIPIIDVIVLDNRTRVDDRVIQYHITQQTDQPLDLPRLKNDLGRIYELGIFESVEFELDQQGGWTVLTVIAHEKYYAPTLLHLGVAYRQSYTGRSRFMLSGRLILLELNRLGAEWRNDFSIGAMLGIRSEWYQPLGLARRYFLATRASISSWEISIMDDGYEVGRYTYWPSRFGLDAGLNLGVVAELRTGLRWGWDVTKTNSGSLQVPEVHDDAAEFVSSLRIDMVDNHGIPRRGYSGNLNLLLSRPDLGATRNYDRLDGDFLVAGTRGRNTLQVHLEGGSDFGSDMPYYRFFALGGLRRLSGYKDFELRGRAFALANLGYLRRLGGEDLWIATRWYLGLWFDVGNIWETTSQVALDDLIYCGAISLVADTLIGPIQIAYGRADTGRYEFYLNIGVHISTPMNQ